MKSLCKSVCPLSPISDTIVHNFREQLTISGRVSYVCVVWNGVCVFVCARESARERERQRERQAGREGDTARARARERA